MKHTLRFTPLVAALLLAAAAGVQAQTSSSRSVTQVPQRPAPSAFAPPAAGPSAPIAAGLPSPLRSPGGLSSQFPAGLPTPSPFPAGMPPVASPVVPSLGTASGSGTVATPTATGTIVTPATDGTVLAQPATAGAGVSNGGASYAAGAAAVAGGTGAAAQAMGAPAPAGPYTAVQLAQSFLQADANRDGELTRAEFQRLTIMPLGFDDMDRDKNGVVSRSEYEDGVR